jgi:hypothetical protein
VCRAWFVLVRKSLLPALAFHFPPQLMRMALHVTGVCLGIILAARTHASGQRAQEITESPALCRTCVELKQLAIIGDTSGPGAIEESRDVVVDHAGRFWVGLIGAVKVFDQRGKFLATVGRPGEGPLEFNWARPRFVDKSGRVHVFDRNNRVTIISPDFKYVGMYQAPPGVLAALALRDDVYVANMVVRTPSGLGEPLHIVDGGHVLKSFGILPTDLDAPITDMTSKRRLALSPSGRLVASKTLAYELGVWTRPGQTPGTDLRGPRLNEQLPQMAAFSKDNPVPNEILDIFMPDERYLWVVIARRRADWLEKLVEVRDPTGRVALSIKPGSSIDDILSGQIDVIDTGTWTIKARVESRTMFLRFLQDGSLLARRTTADGIPQLIVLRPTLTSSAR